MRGRRREWKARLAATVLTSLLAAALTVSSVTQTAGAIPAPLPQTGGPNLSFVIASYADFEGRQPTNAEEIQLDTGTSRGALVHSLVTSAHWDGVVIGGLYQSILHRTPSAAALDNWVNQVRTGRLTLAGVAERFYASDEFYSSGASGSSLQNWVISLYLDILDKTGTPAHISQWMDTARMKGRLFVATQFYESLGSRLIRTTSLYNTVLHRDPSSAARTARAAELLTGGDKAVTFDLADSLEYYNGAASRYTHYTATILGMLPGDDAGSRALGVNDNGVVVGSSGKSTSVVGEIIHAFVYNPATHTMVKIDPLPNDTNAVATAVNNHGLVTGYSYNSFTGAHFHAFTYDLATSVTTDIATRIGDADTVATGINDNGLVVGWTRGAAWTYDTATHTTTHISQVGWGFVGTTGIDDAGDFPINELVVAEHAYVYHRSTNTITDLSSRLPPGASEATGINRSGIVVGTADHMAYTYDTTTDTITNRSPGLTATFPTGDGPARIGGKVIAGGGGAPATVYFYDLTTGRESTLEGFPGTLGHPALVEPTAANDNNEIVGEAELGGTDYATVWQ